ncbi:MAG: hypothetical protein LBI78_01020 [Campylobacteraceae bacterium]|jgi:hypothetical protein|nr:hypothetical protein [Campylobacteraceae bacterium]
MAQIIISTILVIILLVFIFARIENFSKVRKIIICILCTLLVVAIVVYQLLMDKRSDINRELINLFDRGEKLICKEYEVENTKFNYVGGTKVFVGLERFNDIKGAVVSIEECRLK